MLNILQPISFNTFFKQVERVFGEVRLPFHFSKYSNKLYNNFVHVYLLILKERHRCSYRRLTELLNDINVLRMLGIQKLPHFTTLQKFVSRISKDILQKLVMACHKLINSKDLIVAVDSTGFVNVNPTYYYLNRCGIRPPYKNFTQTSIVVDTNTKLVLNICTNSHRKNDTQSFIPLLDKLKHNIVRALADKGYDSRELREYCWNNNITVHIPFRKLPCYQTPSDNRIKAMRRFRTKSYNKRSVVESVISAIKRTTSGFVTATKQDNQQKQVILKVLTYNLEKLSRNQKIISFTILIY